MAHPRALSERRATLRPRHGESASSIGAEAEDDAARDNRAMETREV
jgi:hypothetical protein